MMEPEMLNDTNRVVTEGDFEMRPTGLSSAKDPHQLDEEHSLLARRASVSIAILQAIIVIVVEILIFTTVSSEEEGFLPKFAPNGRPVFLIIFILAQLYQIILVIDAILARNSFQVFGFLFFNFCQLLYAVLQLQQFLSAVPVQDRSTKLLIYIIVVLVTIAVACMLFTFFAYKLFKEFTWSIYTDISASVAVRDMFREYHIFFMLIKLDAFFFLGFAVQFIVLITQVPGFEIALTIVAFPILLAVLIGAMFAVRKEIRSVMLVAIVVMFLAIAYFIFRIIRIWTDPEGESRYGPLRVYMTAFSAISLVVSIASFYYAIRCYRNFGNGLKEFIKREHYGLFTTVDRKFIRPRMQLDDEDETTSRVNTAPTMPAGSWNEFTNRFKRTSKRASIVEN